MILTIIYWLLLLAMSLPLFYFGVTKVIRNPAKMAALRHLGFPVWFLILVGVGEISGGALLLIPEYRWWGVVLTAFILVAAIISHYRAGDPAKQVMVPFWVLVHLGVIVAFGWLM